MKFIKDSSTQYGEVLSLGAGISMTENSSGIPEIIASGTPASTHLLADTTGLGGSHTVVGLSVGEMFQATASTDAAFIQTNIVNATIYGAIGDGSTDCTTALQITADVIRSGSGGVLYIPEGTYLISNVIYIGSNTIIRGVSRNSTFVKRKSGTITDSTPAGTAAVFATGSANGVPYTIGSRGQNVAFEDLTVDGNYSGNPGVTSNTPHGDGIRAEYTDRIVLNRVTLVNCLNSGVYLYGCRDSFFYACYADTCGQLSVAGSRNGFHITGPQDDAQGWGAADRHSFISCVATNNQDEGFAVGRQGMISIANCFAFSNGDHGIEGDSGTATTDITDVPSGWAINNCHIYNNTGTGIGLSNSNVQKIVISNNRIENNSQAGISVTFNSGSDIDVTGNFVAKFGAAGSSYHGITIGAGFSHVVVANNLIVSGSASGGAGIAILSQTPVRHINVSDNLVENVAGACIAITGGVAGGSVVGNSCIGSSVTGIDVMGGGSSQDITGLVLAENSLINNGVRGIWIRTPNSGNISGIKIRDNVAIDTRSTKIQQYGLVATQTGGTITNIRLDNNDFWDNLTGPITGLSAAMLDQINTPIRVQSVSYSSTITPDPRLGEIIEVGTLTGNITVANPSVGTGIGWRGQKMTFRFVQDGTGGKQVVFSGTAWKENFQNNWNGANNRCTVSFIYESATGFWVQNGEQGPSSQSGSFDITIFGADPTGGVDSRSAIQETWDTMVGAGGGQLYLPAGTYKIGPPGLSFINGGDNLSIYGPGARLVANGTFTTPFITLGDATGVTRTNYFTWEGVRLYGSNYTGTQPGLVFVEGFNCSFHDLLIQGFPGDGLVLSGKGYNNRFYGATIWLNSGTGVKDDISGTLGFTPMWWYASRIEGNGRYGLDITTDQSNFIGCTFQSNAKESSSFYDVICRDKVSNFIGCQFEHTDPASAADERIMMYTNSGATVGISNCTFSGNRTGAFGHTGVRINSKVNIDNNTRFRDLALGWEAETTNAQGNIGHVVYTNNASNFNATNMTNYSQVGPQVAPIFRFSQFLIDNGDLIVNKTTGHKIGVSIAKTALMTWGGASSGSISAIGADLTTDTTAKSLRIGLLPYTTSQIPVAAMHVAADGSDNVLWLGGGTAAMQAATVVRVVTAAAINTQPGTTRWVWNSSGHYLPNATNTYDLGATTLRPRVTYGQIVDSIDYIGIKPPHIASGTFLNGTWAFGHTSTGAKISLRWDEDENAFTVFREQDSISPGTYAYRLRNAADSVNLFTVDWDGNLTATSLAGDASGLTGINIDAGTTGTLPVERGGTETTSFTARAVILGGTGSQTALRNVSGLGTSGQILTSNGPGVDPTWQDSAAASRIFTYPGDDSDIIELDGAGAPATVWKVRYDDTSNRFEFVTWPEGQADPGDTDDTYVMLTVASATGVYDFTSGKLQVNGTSVQNTAVFTAGTLSVTRGGTGVSDPAVGNLLVGSGSSPMTLLAPGTIGGFVRSNGAAWVRSTILAGDLPTHTHPYTDVTFSGLTIGHVWRATSATAASFGTLTNAAFADNTIAHARLVNISQNQVLGRTAAGSGAVSAINTSALTGLDTGGITTGTLSVTRGGTGVSNPTSGNLLVGAGSSAMTLIAPGTAGNYLRSTGSTWISQRITPPDISSGTFPNGNWIFGSSSTGAYVTVRWDEDQTALTIRREQDAVSPGTFAFRLRNAADAANILTMSWAGTISTTGDISGATVSATTGFSGSGINITSISENNITDSTILARVASTETISGLYTFTHSSGIRAHAGIALENEGGDLTGTGGYQTLYAQSGGVLKLRDGTGTIHTIASTSNVVLKNPGTIQTISHTNSIEYLQLKGPDASSGTPLQNSPSLRLTGSHWDGIGPNDLSWDTRVYADVVSGASRYEVWGPNISGTSVRIFQASSGGSFYAYGDTQAYIGGETYGFQTALATLRINGSRAAPSRLLATETIGEWNVGGQFSGTAGHIEYAAASIKAFAGGDWSPISTPAYWRVYTTSSGSRTPIARWQFTASGHIIAESDGAYNIGSAGANRPSGIYAVNAVIVGTDPGGTGKLRTDGNVIATGNANRFGNVGTGISGSPIVGIVGTTQLVLASNLTDFTLKNARIAAQHWNNSEEPVGLIFADIASGTNLVVIGGGSSVLNTATEIRFVTASNSITTTGTIRSRFYDNGTIEHWSNDSVFAGITFYTYSADYTMRFRRAQGTRASPSGLGGGATMGVIAFDGAYDTTPNYSIQARIYGLTAGSWNSGSRGAEIFFATTSTGGTSMLTRWQMADTGEFHPFADNSYDLGLSTLRIRTVYTDDIRLGTSTEPGQFYHQIEYDNGTITGNFTVDWTRGNMQKVKAGGNATVTFTAPSGPTTITLRVIGDGTPRTFTWPSTVKWNNVPSPSLPTTNNSWIVLVFYYDGANYTGIAWDTEVGP